MDDYKPDDVIPKKVSERCDTKDNIELEPATKFMYELLNDVDEQQTIEARNELHDYLENTHGELLDEESADFLCTCCERANLENVDIIHLFISSINILVNSIPNPHYVICAHNLLERIMDIFQPDLPGLHAMIFGIIEIVCEDFLKSNDKEYEEMFLEFLEKLFTFGFEENPELNAIRPAIFRSLTLLIKAFDNFHDRADQIYTAFTTFLFSELPYKGDTAPILKAFRIFLKKEITYYTNFIGDRVAPRLVELISLNFISSAREAIKILMPLLDSSDFIEVLLEAEIFNRLIDFLQVPSLVFPLALHALQLMSKTSIHVCSLIEESGFLRRPQLYFNQIYGYVIRKDILGLINNQIEHEFYPQDPKLTKLYTTAIVSAFDDTDEEILRLCLSNTIALVRSNPDFSFEKESDNESVSTNLERILNDYEDETTVGMAECLQGMLFGAVQE